MPIYGDSLDEVAREFQGHLNSLLTKTITRTPIRPWYIQSMVDGERKQVALFGFQQPGGGAGSAEIRTKYGRMRLYIGQTCDVVQEEGQSQLRLRTIEYAYSIEPLEMDDRLLRWEYVKFPGEDSYWCRHHVQGPISFEIPEQRHGPHNIDLNDWHLPTGWVTIEEVVRFCLHDLGVRPLTSPDDPSVWDKILADSYTMFRTRYALFGEM